MEGFTAQQAVRLTGCTGHQLRYWDQKNLVSPSLQSTGGRPGRRRLYSFRDMVALRVVKSLLDNGMSLQRIRRAWSYLRRAGDMDAQLAKIALDASQANDSDEAVISALLEGQLAFFASINAIARQVEDDITRFELDRESFLETIRQVEDDVLSEASGT